METHKMNHHAQLLIVRSYLLKCRVRADEKIADLAHRVSGLE